MTNIVTGFWTGEYTYDAVKGLVVEFQADLEQAGSMFSGYTTEQNTFGDQAGQFLLATLFGTVIKRRINFTKTYTNGPTVRQKILYEQPNGQF